MTKSAMVIAFGVAIVVMSVATVMVAPATSTQHGTSDY
jgi:hypothetical protein